MLKVHCLSFLNIFLMWTLFMIHNLTGEEANIVPWDQRISPLVLEVEKGLSSGSAAGSPAQSQHLRPEPHSVLI